MKYEAVVFDLDGTLTDTLSDLKNSVNYALSEFGFPERSLDEVRRFVGNGVRRLMYLSDSDLDCVTARNAGLPCIGAAWGFRGREVLAENGADFIIDRPSEILDLI